MNKPIHTAKKTSYHKTLLNMLKINPKQFWETINPSAIPPVALSGSSGKQLSDSEAASLFNVAFCTYIHEKTKRRFSNNYWRSSRWTRATHSSSCAWNNMHYQWYEAFMSGWYRQLHQLNIKKRKRTNKHYSSFAVYVIPFLSLAPHWLENRKSHPSFQKQR